MTTLRPGIIYQAVQDQRDRPISGWVIFDKWGKVGYAFTLEALRDKAKGNLMDINGGKRSTHLHRGKHPQFKSDVLDRFMDGDEPCEEVSIYWFVLLGAEIDLEEI